MVCFSGKVFLESPVVVFAVAQLGALTHSVKGLDMSFKACD